MEKGERPPRPSTPVGVWFDLRGFRTRTSVNRLSGPSRLPGPSSTGHSGCEGRAPTLPEGLPVPRQIVPGVYGFPSSRDTGPVRVRRSPVLSTCVRGSDPWSSVWTPKVPRYSDTLCHLLPLAPTYRTNSGLWRTRRLGPSWALRLTSGNRTQVSVRGGQGASLLCLRGPVP